MNPYILSNEYVADTVAIVVFLENRRLGSDSERIFESANVGRTVIHIPAIAVAEIMYLSEKQRIKVGISELKHLMQHHHNFRISALGLLVLEHAERISDVPELHDRLIAATAASKNLELMTTDQTLINSQFVKTVW